MRLSVLVVVIWLITGVIALIQRGCLSGSSSNCAKASNTAVTIVAGPLNYVAINPEDQMHGAAAVEEVHPHQLRRFGRTSTSATTSGDAGYLRQRSPPSRGRAGMRAGCVRLTAPN